MFDNNKIIPNLEFPKAIRPILSSLQNIMEGSIKKFGIDLETGNLQPLKGLKEDQEFVWLVFIWIAESQEVLDNLNLVLTDLDLLRNSIFKFKGLPNKRLFLLLRMYFYEYFRTKELFSHFVKNLRKSAFIDKEVANNFKKMFQELFNHMYIFRNKLVHTSMRWRGIKQNKLNFICKCLEYGFILLDKDNDEFELQSIVKDVIDEYYHVLKDEGLMLRNIIQGVSNALIEHHLDKL